MWPQGARDEIAVQVGGDKFEMRIEKVGPQHRGLRAVLADKYEGLAWVGPIHRPCSLMSRIGFWRLSIPVSAAVSPGPASAMSMPMPSFTLRIDSIRA